MPDVDVEKARRGGGARGLKGAPAPQSAAIHTPMKAGSPEWHSSKRAAMANQAHAARAKHNVGSKMPAVRHGGFTCGGCGRHDWREHPVVTKEGAHHATLAFQGCTHCGTMHVSHVGVAHKHAQEELDVTKNDSIAKDVDASETALQTQGAGDGVTHRTGCPRGGSAPCGKDVGGRCSACNAVVSDHQAEARKSLDDVLLDVRKIAGI